MHRSSVEGKNSGRENSICKSHRVGTGQETGCVPQSGWRAQSKKRQGQARGVPHGAGQRWRFPAGAPLGGSEQRGRTQVSQGPGGSLSGPPIVCAAAGQTHSTPSRLLTQLSIQVPFLSLASSFSLPFPSPSQPTDQSQGPQLGPEISCATQSRRGRRHPTPSLLWNLRAGRAQGRHRLQPAWKRRAGSVC